MRIFNPAVDAIVRRVYMHPDSSFQPGGILEAEVKHVSEEVDIGPEDLIQILVQEIKSLRHLIHDNILRYVGSYWEFQMLNICLEYFPGKNISVTIKEKGGFSEPDIRRITKQILEGLQYLHANGTLHKRLRGENILLGKDGSSIKLAEFGISTQPSDLVIKTGNWPYRDEFWLSPESALGEDSMSADIWSVGCTVIEMATGTHPWVERFVHPCNFLMYVAENKSCTPSPPIPDGFSQEAKDFLKKCLQGDPSLRPTASELLEDPFIKNEYTEPCSHLGTFASETSGKGAKHSIFSNEQSVSEGNGDPARLKMRAAFDDKSQELKKLPCGISSVKEHQDHMLVSEDGDKSWSAFGGVLQ